MKEIQSIRDILLALFITISLYGCGGGGGVYNPPSINIANTLINKIVLDPDNKSIDSRHFFSNRNKWPNLQAFFKKTNTYVHFFKKSNYPETTLFCKNENDKTLWELKFTYPLNSINGIYVDSNKCSSEIFVLWGGGIEQYVTVVDELGFVKFEFPLEGTKKFDSFYTVIYSRPSIVKFDDEIHIIAETGEGIGIFNIRGKLLSFINLPRYPYGHFAKELISTIGDKYLTIMVDQQPTSHSSTLLILSKDLHVIYEEFLLGAEWMGFSKNNKNALFISTENKWKPDNVWLKIVSQWKYTIK